MLSTKMSNFAIDWIKRDNSYGELIQAFRKKRIPFEKFKEFCEAYQIWEPSMKLLDPKNPLKIIQGQKKDPTNLKKELMDIYIDFQTGLKSHVEISQDIKNLGLNFGEFKIRCQSHGWWTPDMEGLQRFFFSKSNLKIIQGGG